MAVIVWNNKLEKIYETNKVEKFNEWLRLNKKLISKSTIFTTDTKKRKVIKTMLINGINF